MGIFSGDPDALLLVIFIWVFLLIIAKFFTSKSLWLEEYFQYIILGAVIHVAVSAAILIWHYSPGIAIGFSISVVTIILVWTFRDPIITALYEVNILSLSYQKIVPKGLELKNHSYMISTRPVRFVSYLSIKVTDTPRLFRALKTISRSGASVAVEFYGNASKIECHLGIHVSNRDQNAAITDLQVATDAVLDACRVHDITARRIVEAEALERIHFLPLLAYKFSEDPKLKYQRKIEDNLTVSYNNFDMQASALNMYWDSTSSFDLLAFLAIIAKTKQDMRPFWLAVYLQQYSEKQLEHKKFKLRRRFQHVMKKIKEELKVDPDKVPIMQLFANTHSGANQDAHLYSFLFRNDYEQFEAVKQEVLAFQEGLNLGLWHASFTLVVSKDFLMQFKKYSDVDHARLNKRQLLHALKRTPLHGQDLNSLQVSRFMGND